MSDIIFNVTLDIDNGTLTVVDRGSDVDDVTSLIFYIKGEDKDNPLYTMEVTDSGDIAAFFNENVGLVYLTTDIFGTSIPDNYYIINCTANAGTIQSEQRVFTMTDTIRALIESMATSVNVPVKNLFTGITFCMMLQTLELMDIISIEAAYTYDRENKWRKLYNYLNTITDVNKY